MIDRDRIDPTQTDAFRKRRIEVESDRETGMGTWIGLAIAALIIVGGFVYYQNRAPATLAANSPTPAITSPSITPAQPAVPMAPAPAPADTPAR